MAYGYRFDEVPLPVPTEVKKGTVIKIGKQQPETRRDIVAASLPLCINGVAQPKVDPKDQATTKKGVEKRAACKPPIANRTLLGEFKVYVRKWLEENLQPLTLEEDVSFETWISSTTYPEWRKQQLRDELDTFRGVLTDREVTVKSFVKDESYGDWKHSRLINARTDVFKCLVGPYFKAIENSVYRLPQFIKHVPVSERPKYIFDYLQTHGSTYGASDYTAFESLFTAELMDACEFQLYEYMTQNVYEGAWFMQTVRKVLAGMNRCETRGMNYRIKATRMSGEMCTSLGNGFTNLMVLNFLAERSGSKTVKIVVEGDDALFTLDGPYPAVQDFTEMGLVVKLEHHQNLATASFCGLVFDEEELVNIADPIKILATIGWTTRQYAGSRTGKMLDLLRSKGLSLLFQYPGAPVISALARACLRIAPRRDISYLRNSGSMSWWEREKFDNLLKSCSKNRIWELCQIRPGPRTRVLMEVKFGLSIEDQLIIERQLDEITAPGLLRLGVAENNFPAPYSHYWQLYVQKREARDMYPGEIWFSLGKGRGESYMPPD